MIASENVDGAGAAPTGDVLAGLQDVLRRAASRELCCRGLAASREDVEEVVQEANCRLLESGAWRRLPGRRSEAVLHAYLRRVARSALIDRLRADAAAKRGGGRLESVEEMRGTGVLPERVDPEPSPEEGLLSRERRERLSARLRALMSGRRTARSARIVELALIEEWSGAEIAAWLGDLSEGGVHTLLWRARRALSSLGPEALLEG